MRVTKRGVYLTWRELGAVRSALEEQFAGDPFAQYGDEESCKKYFRDTWRDVRAADRLLERLRAIPRSDNEVPL